MQIIYSYDENGIFINESLADESPLEPGVFLIPANSTTVKPLEHKDGFYIKFNSELNEFQYEEKVVEVDEEKIEEPKLDENNVPLSITPLQAKLQLLEIELLDEVEELVKQDRRVEIYWTNAQKFNKDDEILKSMAIALGLSDTQLDDLFIKASKL